ncbi:Hypothetical predicted protein [Mytilus galloprovincialis]|uniref:Uncharacterized protein n=1 Tax=Mytilus galloprovincialis TaxID=29158 RepID=A0A8B6GLT4_MYTGA|nr:Hypothetical predicted protein [Mytilus galloprovincialis]
MDNTRNSNQHQMSDQHTGVQLINQQSRIPNQANPLFMTPMAPPHYSQIPTEQSRINPGHIQAPMYHNSRIQAIPLPQKNDEVKAHTEVSHQVDVTPRTGLITTASSGDAPLEADCHQKFPSQRGANVGGPKHLKGLVQADNLEAKEDGNRKKPNHFLGSGRSNKIKGRISL